MITCDAVQERLAEIGAAALEEDAALARHLAGCEACSALWADLQALEADLAALPEADAPEALVSATLEKVRQAEAPRTRPAAFGNKRQQIAAALAACVVLAASLGLGMSYLGAPEGMSSFRMAADSSGAVDREANEQLAEAVVADSNDEMTFAKTEEVLPEEAAGAPLAVEEKVAAQVEAERFEARQQKKDETVLGGAYRDGAAGREAGGQLGAEAELLARLLLPADSRRSGMAGEKADSDAANAPLADAPARTLESDSMAQSLDAVTGFGDDKGQVLQDGGVAGGRADDLAALADALSRPESQAVPAAAEPLAKTPQSELQAASQSPAAAFLQNLASLDGLTFQDPEGYWANSYIPGDPEMRLLAAQLLPRDRARLDAQVRRVSQPFDAPRDAAMALFLHADKTAIEGPTRLRLQVGLKGADRLGGQRPEMNLALVLDLRDLKDPAEAARSRALVTALERARRPGDRFSLIVAGPDGGLLVTPEDFLHGPIALTMARLFGGTIDPAARPMDLMAAMELASESLRAGDDPNAVLGSSLLLLASAAPLTAELPALERLAHENAIAGLALSVVRLGKGDGGDLDAVDRLVAAGQGQRRILTQAGDAEALIDRELHAASRAVARALRLRIRLAPGVRLVDVLGSGRLDAPDADKVRAAETAIDQRLARNLGIAADRGADEEGIQIVIPSFFAGDDHVILLDVVAEGPGPLAEVTLRYKDLISHENAVARASVSLPAGKGRPDPLAENVLKNRVAYALSSGLRSAARALAAGGTQAAIGEIVKLIELVRGLRSQVAGWSSDAVLLADEALLADYRAALEEAGGAGPGPRRQLAESMAYAAHLKLQKTTPLARSE